MNFFNEKPVLVHALVVAGILATFFVAGITVIADLVPAIKNWLAATHGHHWVGKGVWTIGVFLVGTVIAYIPLKRTPREVSARLIHALAAVAALGTLVIFGFFVYEYTK